MPVTGQDLDSIHPPLIVLSKQERRADAARSSLTAINKQGEQEKPAPPMWGDVAIR